MAKLKKQRSARNQSFQTKRAILDILKQEGPRDSLALAAQLNMTGMAVRQHLYAMQNDKLVTFEEEQRPVGRPAKLWKLTRAANRYFPDGHADLTVTLLESIRHAFGEKGIDQLISVRTQRQIANYGKSISKRAGLAGKIQALADLRSAEGYMAEVQADTDGSFLLVENHCPICTAANTCQGLCRGELTVFEKVLGKDVRVERTEHIVTGARRCVYRVRKLNR